MTPTTTRGPFQITAFRFLFMLALAVGVSATPVFGQVTIEERIELGTASPSEGGKGTEGSEKALNGTTIVVPQDGRLLLYFSSADRLYAPIPDSATVDILIKSGDDPPPPVRVPLKTIGKRARKKQDEETIHEPVLPYFPIRNSSTERFFPCDGGFVDITQHDYIPGDAETSTFDAGYVSAGDTLIFSYTSDTGTYGGTLTPSGDGSSWEAELGRYNGCLLTFEERVMFFASIVGAEIDILDADREEASFVQVARWDDAYATTGDSSRPYRVRNGAANNFIDRDPERFYVQVTDSSANADPQIPDSVTARVSTLRPGGVEDDNLTDLMLAETGVDTGVFESEAQMLTARDFHIVDPSSVEGTSVPAAIDSLYRTDDNFAAHDGENGPVPDDATGDRTHRVRVGGAVKVEYDGGGNTLSTDVPACHPDSARTLQLRTVVFNEPFRDEGYTDPETGQTIGAGNEQFDYDDANGNGQHDAGEESEPYFDLSSFFDIFPTEDARNTANFVESTRPFSGTVNVPGDGHGPVLPDAQVDKALRRASVHWAQACVRVAQSGSIIHKDAPKNQRGEDITANQDFFQADPRAGGDAEILFDAFRDEMSADVPTVYFAAPLTTDSLEISGAAYSPYPGWSESLRQQLTAGTYSYTVVQYSTRPRVLAHELGHLLTRWFDESNPGYIFFPQLGSPLGDARADYRVDSMRRLSLGTVNQARQVGIANDLLKLLP